jgi:hypothetical protein
MASGSLWIQENPRDGHRSAALAPVGPPQFYAPRTGPDQQPHGDLREKLLRCSNIHMKRRQFNTMLGGVGLSLSQSNHAMQPSVAQVEPKRGGTRQCCDICRKC